MAVGFADFERINRKCLLRSVCFNDNRDTSGIGIKKTCYEIKLLPSGSYLSYIF